MKTKKSKPIHVVAAVIKKNNRYLCAQRANNKYLAYKWEFPGGKVEKNECLEDSLLREIKEELGSTILIKRHLLTTKHHYDFACIKLDAFLCTLVDEQFQCIEHNKIVWLTLDELLALDWAEADLPIVTLLINENI